MSFREPTDKRLKERVKALEKDLAREKLLLDSFRIEARRRTVSDERSPAPELQAPKETPREVTAAPEEDAGLVATSIPSEAILLNAGLVTKNEKTGRYRVTAKGRRFLKGWWKAQGKALPAWLRNKQEAELVVSRLSAILS